VTKRPSNDVPAEPPPIDQAELERREEAGPGAEAAAAAPARKKNSRTKMRRLREAAGRPAERAAAPNARRTRSLPQKQASR
jgi:hypothetical protein